MSRTGKKAKFKNRAVLEAKGHGAIRTTRNVSSEVKTKTAQVSREGSSLTSYDVFRLCIERAKNLIKIHQAAHGKKERPEKYLADAHRAAIVLAISALDAFVRMFVISRIRALLADKALAIPDALSERIKKFLDQGNLLEAARKDDLLDRVEKAFKSDFEKRSIQGTKAISEHMKLVGYEDIFHQVAITAKLNEDTLRSDLDRYTVRRHEIAHRGDYDLSQNPPKENEVTKQDVLACIKLVTKVAEHINRLGSKS